jgi:hypothetical protein
MIQGNINRRKPVELFIGQPVSGGGGAQPGYNLFLRLGDRDPAINRELFHLAGINHAHVELELARDFVLVIAKDAGGVGVLADFLGNKIDGFGMDTDGVQGDAQAGNGVDARQWR